MCPAAVAETSDPSGDLWIDTSSNPRRRVEGSQTLRRRRPLMRRTLRGCRWTCTQNRSVPRAASASGQHQEDGDARPASPSHRHA